MISFNVSAIDIILALAVIVLGVLYLRKVQSVPESLSFSSVKHDIKQQDPSYDFQSLLPESFSDFEELDDSDEEISVFSDSF
jgi:hypothetical protein